MLGASQRNRQGEDATWLLLEVWSVRCRTFAATSPPLANEKARTRVTVELAAAMASSTDR